MVKEALDSLMNGSPWWMKILMIFGPSTAIALVLVGFLMTQVSASLAQVQTKLDVAAANQASHFVQAAVTAKSVEDTGACTMRYLALICQNTAKTDVQKQACAAVR